MALPDKLDQWLIDKGAENKRIDAESLLPSTKERRPFVIATIPLKDLVLEDHEFNPRTPKPGKIKEIAASIHQMGLLSPLTCCWLKDKKEMRLIDGRHRYEALQYLYNGEVAGISGGPPIIPQDGSGDKEWGDAAVVDVKVYYDLAKSDIYILATYLNRTRRNLHKGEYYKVIVDIFDNKERELMKENGRRPMESEVFTEISSRELAEPKFDLSVGRLVGLAAFDDSDRNHWYPFVGNHQSDTVDDDADRRYCPITAGNLGAFLKPLCKTSAYDDHGEARAQELANVLSLSLAFQDANILRPVTSTKSPSRETASCKHWPLVAFGQILGEWNALRDEHEGERLFTRDLGDYPDSKKWTLIRRAVSQYADTMEEQAKAQAKFMKSGAKEDLERAWSYQTQTNQILPRLKEALEEEVGDIDFHVTPKGLR